MTMSHQLEALIVDFQNCRPNYRYPYYDASGKGHLVYGYGGPELYSYNKFTPLEGIYRRR